MAASAALATLALGCGGGGASDADGRAVAVAAERLQRAFADRDLPELCARMTRRAIEQAGSVAHGTPSACGPDLRRALRVVRADSWDIDARSSVRAVEVEGDQATATVNIDGRSIDVPLAREGGRWKLDSFFGTARARVTARPPALPGAGEGVAVSLRQGSVPMRCGRFLAPYPAVAGGCDMTVRGPAVGVSILTPFGGFRFARCRVSYQVAIDGAGRTWTRQVSFEGNLRDGCGDVRPCDRNDVSLPWKGRIYSDPDGTLRHRVGVCLDTCIGFYEGELVTRLVRRGRHWQVVAEGAGVGRSGFTLRGRLSATGGALEIRGEGSA